MKLDEGHGVYYDVEGGQYLDFTSGGIFQAILGNDFIYEAYRLMEEPAITSCYGHTNYWTERYKDMLKEFTGFESDDRCIGSVNPYALNIVQQNRSCIKRVG